MVNDRSTPVVSVITATYNRSNVLRYSIEIVLAQTFRAWELIVVGDACTDDTEDVVAAFEDPRIRFVNLSANTGDQSRPNNEGVRLSRGRYIAYLNHDDLWLPAHLATMVEAIEATAADLVFSLMSLLDIDGSSRLAGVCPSGRFEPHVGVPASSWLLRRSLADDVGPWRHYRDCYLVPSQDWLHRAHRAQKVLIAVPRLGVIVIQSGTRPRSYADRQDAEHRHLAERLRMDREFLVRELTALAVGHASRDPTSGVSLAVRPYVVRALKNVVRRCLLAFGVNPVAAASRLRLRRGTTVDRLRRLRGLPSRGRRKGK